MPGFTNTLIPVWDPLGEASGLVPDDAWKRRVLDEGWATGDNVNLAIGQGFLLVTPLQMCRMVAAVANGGTLFRPQIVGRVAGNYVETDLLGSMEFATAAAGSKLIVVLGHSACGAVKGAIDRERLSNSIRSGGSAV